MKSIRDKFITFLKNEDIRRDVKDIIKPISELIYNETYLYIWFICVYNVLLLFIILANLFILIRLMKTQKPAILPI
jgi:hypothetical protein